MPRLSANWISRFASDIFGDSGLLILALRKLIFLIRGDRLGWSDLLESDLFWDKILVLAGFVVTNDLVIIFSLSSKMTKTFS